MAALRLITEQMLKEARLGNTPCRAYAYVEEEELDYTIRNVAETADKMEQFLEPGEDLA